MRPKKRKKIRFSKIMSKVQFDKGALQIQQLQGLALVLMGVFLGVLIWLIIERGAHMPLLIQLGIGLAVIILLWGLYDVATTKVQLIYQPQNDLLILKAQRRGFRLHYNGSAKERLFLSVQKQMTGKSNIQRFMVQLSYEDNRCHIPFVLEGNFHNQAEAAQELQNWQQKLKI